MTSPCPHLVTAPSAQYFPFGAVLSRFPRIVVHTVALSTFHHVNDRGTCKTCNGGVEDSTFDVSGKLMMINNRTAVIIEYFKGLLAITDENDDACHRTTYALVGALCDVHIIQSGLRAVVLPAYVTFLHNVSGKWY